MWFRNLQLYRLPTPWNIDLAKFDEQLSQSEGIMEAVCNLLRVLLKPSVFRSRRDSAEEDRR